VDVSARVRQRERVLERWIAIPSSTLTGTLVASHVVIPMDNQLFMDPWCPRETVSNRSHA
jgi:hypothetical protein